MDKEPNRTANGIRQTYEYDGRGQLLAVKENGVHVERYAYDKAGNMLKKTIRGKTTTFAFDGANQLVSSTTDGVTTQYAYDAAGRLVKEGNKTYRYGYLDKVLSVTEGERKYTYDYHVDGQLARANYGNGKAEDFGWDGLSLIKRGDERFVNESHIGGGNPVYSTKGVSYFNDMLGTTVGAKKSAKYSAAALSAFGEGGSRHTFFTGKPQVDGLGYAFLMRNYRAGLAKWQTADPLGYPDGWNQLAYCGNGMTSAVDLWGCSEWRIIDEWNTLSDYVWEEVSRTAPSWETVARILGGYGDFGWMKPHFDNGNPVAIGDPTSRHNDDIRENYMRFELIQTFTFQRIETLQVIVTTKELKDDPSLQNALVSLVGTLGSEIRSPIGKAIGVANDVESIENALDEIKKCIKQYGKDTVWTIDLGTITYKGTRIASLGSVSVKE